MVFCSKSGKKKLHCLQDSVFFHPCAVIYEAQMDIWKIDKGKGSGMEGKWDLFSPAFLIKRNRYKGIYGQNRFK